MGRVSDNTVATNALSTRSRSSTIADGMRDSGTVGNDGEELRKVEGLVTFTGRGSSNLPGRIKGPASVSLSPASARGVRPGRIS